MSLRITTMQSYISDFYGGPENGGLTKMSAQNAYLVFNGKYCLGRHSFGC